MAGEAPGGGRIHVGGGEGVEAELGSAGVDVLSDSLQALEVDQLVHAVAGSLDQVGVDDDAVALEAVADGDQAAVLIIEVVGVGVQLIGDGGVGQVHGELAPLLDAGLVADDEEGGRGGLVHLGGQGLAVGAGSGGDDLDGDTGLLGVHLGKALSGLVQFGLEVQPVDRAFISSVGGTADSSQSEDHDQGQNQCDDLFHFDFSFSFFSQARVFSVFIFKPRRVQKSKCADRLSFPQRGLQPEMHRRRAVFQRVEQDADALAPHLLRRLRHGRQRGIGVLRDVQAVDGDDRAVLRHALPVILQRLHGRHRGGIGDREQGGEIRAAAEELADAAVGLRQQPPVSTRSAGS